VILAVAERLVPYGPGAACDQSLALSRRREAWALRENALRCGRRLADMMSDE
jgi:hypothetical protein